MSDEINCQYRSVHGAQPVCQVVADLTERPLAECHTNDSACRFCLGCGIAPQAPNRATASMAHGVSKRLGNPQFHRQVLARVGSVLSVSPPPTKCVLRGPEIRTVACKPCQADSLVPVIVPVFRCPKHRECTLNNTGTHPKIQACSTCEDRLEKAYQLDVRPTPSEVLQAIASRGG